MASCARASRLLFSLWLLSSRVMAQSLSAVMLRRSAELGLRPGWALSNARMPKYPGCSWPEVLDVSDEDYKAALRNEGVRAEALAQKGIFKMKMVFATSNRRFSFYTVGTQLGEEVWPDQFVRPLGSESYEERPEAYRLFVKEATSANGGSMLVASL
jgi:hypothetical protein